MRKNRLNLRYVVKIGVTCLAVCMIYVACNKNDDPSTNGNENNGQWVQKANYPGAAVANALAFSINNKIYVGMGRNATGCKNDLWEYDPSNNRWTEKSDLPVTNISGYNAAYFTANNKAYIIINNDKMWEYNPSNNNWAQKADCPIKIFYNSYSFGINGKGYVGGAGGVNDNSSSQLLYEYNPITDTWKQCADFIGLNRNGITAVSNEQNAYIIGGNGPAYAAYESKLSSDNFWTYSPNNDKWAQKADFPSGIGIVYGLSFCKETSIYAGLGIESRQGSGSASSSDSYTYINVIYKYDANNNSWVQSIKPPIPNRCQAIAIVCNGKLYIGLGAYLYPHPFSSTQYFLDFWEYSF